MMLSKFFNKEQLSNWLIVFKLVGSYLFFSVCFYAYVGIIDPKGSVYIPFLDKYSLIDAILTALIHPCVWLLELLGFSTRHSANTVGLIDGILVRIYFACLGIKIMIAYTALLIAFPGQKRILFWVIGIIAIHALNVARITTIIIGYSHDRGIVHITHDLFNYFGYACVCGFFYFWYSKYGFFKKQTVT